MSRGLTSSEVGLLAAFGIVCGVFLVVVLAELVRWIRLRAMCSRFSENVAAPFIGLSILGSAASVHKRVFASKNTNIFFNRTSLAQQSPSYLCYKWSIRHCLRYLFDSRFKCLLITTDAIAARAALSDPVRWTKRRKPDSADIISSLACTSQNGEASVRQRKVLGAALRGRQQHSVHIQAAAEQLMVEVSMLHEAHGGALDVVPVVQRATLAAISGVIFGGATAATRALLDAFYPYWDATRVNSQEFDVQQRRRRRDELQTMARRVEASLWMVIRERRGVVAGKAAAHKAERSCASCEFDSSAVSPAADAAQDGCVLDKLLRATSFSDHEAIDSGDCISSDELLHNLHNMMIAAFETTSHTICATLYGATFLRRVYIL